MATLTFHGAARTVTGSRTLLESGGESLLVDCGMFQGLKNLRELNWAPPAFDAPSLRWMVLTHAHIDHCGWLPRLYRAGFRGKVFATHATAELTELLLLDSARLQEEDAEFLNRNGATKHKPALPLYDERDVKRVMGLFHAVPYEMRVRLTSRLSFRFICVGHLLGSAMVEVRLTEEVLPAADSTTAAAVMAGAVMARTASTSAVGPDDWNERGGHDPHLERAAATELSSRAVPGAWGAFHDGGVSPAAQDSETPAGAQDREIRAAAAKVSGRAVPGAWGVFREGGVTPTAQDRETRAAAQSCTSWTAQSGEPRVGRYSQPSAEDREIRATLQDGEAPAAARGGRRLTILFSGDVGRFGAPLAPDPKPPARCDVLVMESTYGNRPHGNEDLHEELASVAERTFTRGGVLLVPAFAVGRSQQVIFILRELYERGRLPRLPIHVDSPMAVDATRIYTKYRAELDPLEGNKADAGFVYGPEVTLHRSREQSKQLNAFGGSGRDHLFERHAVGWPHLAPPGATPSRLEEHRAPGGISGCRDARPGSPSTTGSTLAIRRWRRDSITRRWNAGSGPSLPRWTSTSIPSRCGCPISTCSSLGPVRRCSCSHVMASPGRWRSSIAPDHPCAWSGPISRFARSR